MPVVVQRGSAPATWARRASNIARLLCVKVVGSILAGVVFMLVVLVGAIIDLDKKVEVLSHQVESLKENVLYVHIAQSTLHDEVSSARQRCIYYMEKSDDLLDLRDTVATRCEGSCVVRWNVEEEDHGI